MNMKHLFETEGPFKSGPSETNQTLNGLKGDKLEERGARKPILAEGSWHIQSGRSCMRGCEKSDLMKSQLG